MVSVSVGNPNQDNASASVRVLQAPGATEATGYEIQTQATTYQEDESLESRSQAITTLDAQGNITAYSGSTETYDASGNVTGRVTTTTEGGTTQVVEEAIGLDEAGNPFVASRTTTQTNADTPEGQFASRETTTFDAQGNALEKTTRTPNAQGGFDVAQTAYNRDTIDGTEYVESTSTKTGTALTVDGQPTFTGQLNRTYGPDGFATAEQEFDLTTTPPSLVSESDIATVVTQGDNGEEIVTSTTNKRAFDHTTGAFVDEPPVTVTSVDGKIVQAPDQGTRIAAGQPTTDAEIKQFLDEGNTFEFTHQGNGYTIKHDAASDSYKAYNDEGVVVDESVQIGNDALTVPGYMEVGISVNGENQLGTDAAGRPNRLYFGTDQTTGEFAIIEASASTKHQESLLADGQVLARGADAIDAAPEVDAPTQTGVGGIASEISETATAIVNSEGLVNASAVSPDQLTESGFSEISPGVFQKSFTRPADAQGGQPTDVVETWRFDINDQPVRSDKVLTTEEGSTTLTQAFDPVTGDRTNNIVDVTTNLSAGLEGVGLPAGEYTLSLQTDDATGEQQLNVTMPDGSEIGVTAPEGEPLFGPNAQFSQNVSFTMLNGQTIPKTVDVTEDTVDQS